MLFYLQCFGIIIYKSISVFYSVISFVTLSYETFSQTEIFYIYMYILIYTVISWYLWEIVSVDAQVSYIKCHSIRI